MSSPVTIAAFYHFAPLANRKTLRHALQTQCDAGGVRGTILLADEGVNGTIAGPREAVNGILETIRKFEGFDGLHAKFSSANTAPFHRMKVRLKREIVTMGDPEIDPCTRVGSYVSPDAWDEVLNDPDTLVIDTRNDYEVRLGTFEGAINPDIKSFRDFPAWARANLDPDRHKRIAMFCTGGIRCEKASSLLLREGFESVQHLHGGILNYLERQPEDDSMWRGECFVFDQRVSVDHNLSPGTHRMCFGCQEPLSPSDVEHPAYEHGVCCHRCADHTSDTDRKGRRERARQLDLARRRGGRHLGS